MFWVTRRNGRRYLYATRREGGRVKKVYLGTGPLAEDLMARMAEAVAARTARAVAVVEPEPETAAWAEAERAEAELAAGLTTLTRAHLLVAGFRRHDRGAWRRKHGEEESGTPGIGSRTAGDGAH